MEISKNAKFGLVKKYDEDHEIAVAISKDGKNKQIMVKCLSRDLKKEEKDGSKN